MSLPELPAPDRTMWQHGQQIDHYTADQMRAYALQAVEALRREPMTDEDMEEIELAIWPGIQLDSTDRAVNRQFVQAVEAHHHITQKEQG